MFSADCGKGMIEFVYDTHSPVQHPWSMVLKEQTCTITISLSWWIRRQR